MADAGGAIPEPDAREALNLGLGMLLVADPEVVAALTRELVAAGERVHDVGRIVAGTHEVLWRDA